jgi:hypothetical protein
VTALAEALLRAGVVVELQVPAPLRPRINNPGNSPERSHVPLQRRKMTFADLKPTTRLPQIQVTATPSPAAKPKATAAPASAPLPAPTALGAYVPQSIKRDGDGFPCGWCLERASWGFHRSLWLTYGVRLDVGEYTGIVRQGRLGTAWRLARNIWRVKLRNGCEINVGVRKGKPVVVLPDDDWREHIPWIEALAVHLPQPPPRRVLTTAQRAKRRRYMERRAARFAELNLKTSDET